MTILLVDFPSGGRGRYGTDGGFGSGYVQAYYSSGMWLYNDPRPGADGQGIVWGTGQGTNLYMSKGLPDVNYRFIFSLRIFCYSLPYELGASLTFQLWEDQDDSAFNIQIYPDGSFGNGVPAIVPGSWQHIEVMMGAGAGHDGLIIRVDGVDVLNSPTGGTIHRPAFPQPPIYEWKILSSGAPNFFCIKDFVLQYGSTCDFIGQGSVKQLTPVSDISSGWTLTGSATEFEALNNSPPNAGNYISAPDPAVGNPSVTGLAGLRPNTKVITGLWPWYFARSADGGTLQGSLTDGTPRDGATFNPDATSRYYTDYFPVDPVTGVAWDPATVAALDLSINRTV